MEKGKELALPEGSNTGASSHSLPSLHHRDKITKGAWPDCP